MEYYFIGIISLAFVGIFTGIMSGLIGIGGGLIIIPALTVILKIFHIPDNAIMHVAVGTSLCVMICTSFSNVISHSRHKNIVWPIFKTALPGIIIGTILGAIFSKFISGNILSIIFGIFLIVVSIKTYFGFKPKLNKQRTTKRKWFKIVGGLIGFKSGILGVGGGALSVPFLFFCGLDARKVVGTTASFTLPIAVLGTALSLITLNNNVHIPYSTGYIFWPGFIVLSICTVVFVHVGARLVTILPSELIRKIFAFVLLILSLKMLF
ncbi:MAG: sulfite exporter TauE/SafE family protein [bacterium]|nr:sulfite exporter TauE/SafE family protein [bacterium]